MCPMDSRCYFLLPFSTLAVPVPEEATRGSAEILFYSGIMRRNERTQHWWKAYEFNLERNGRSEACVTVRDESKHS
ncbi:uncharacterized protein LOC121590445 isoform X2 [Anopheles merus]|uniref:uncharacterized protein LOC121590445 isoform X2 n=1 Tax=Anopheles merus TaxID=30066 RepID=UPI001BE3D41F|nr:uncharacterized protein LOC121590445 isoform X2 [Anopheles merus]